MSNELNASEFYYACATNNIDKLQEYKAANYSNWEFLLDSVLFVSQNAKNTSYCVASPLHLAIYMEAFETTEWLLSEYPEMIRQIFHDLEARFLRMYQGRQAILLDTNTPPANAKLMTLAMKVSAIEFKSKLLSLAFDQGKVPPRSPLLLALTHARDNEAPSQELTNIVRLLFQRAPDTLLPALEALQKAYPCSESTPEVDRNKNLIIYQTLLMGIDLDPAHHERSYADYRATEYMISALEGLQAGPNLIVKVVQSLLMPETLGLRTPPVFVAARPGQAVQAELAATFAKRSAAAKEGASGSGGVVAAPTSPQPSSLQEAPVRSAPPPPPTRPVSFSANLAQTSEAAASASMKPQRPAPPPPPKPKAVASPSADTAPAKTERPAPPPVPPRRPPSSPATTSAATFAAGASTQPTAGAATRTASQPKSP